MDERTGNANCTECGDRCYRQQAGQDQLGSFGERRELSPNAQSTRFLQLDEVVPAIRFLEVCRGIGRTKTQSNGVPENLWRNKVFYDRRD